MLYYDCIDISKGVDLAKSNYHKKHWFVNTGFLIMDSNFKVMYAMVALIQAILLLSC